jgi:hypothetical protein
MEDFERKVLIPVVISRIEQWDESAGRRID